MSFDIPEDGIALGDAMLTVSDFGVAFRPEDKSRLASYTPLALRPPEAFFEVTTPLSFASDVWSLGCVLFELFASCSLFEGSKDAITAQQVDIQGPMPPAWREKWGARQLKWYDEECRLLRGSFDPYTWTERFQDWVQDPRLERRWETLAEDELDALIELLRCMLAWSPSERLDISGVLRSDWMTRWALPAYQKCLEVQKCLEH